MEIKNINIKEIKPYKKNPRVNKSAIVPVKKSLKEFGFRQPIVVDKDNVIIVGHTRYYAAKELGMTEVPVHTADNLTNKQIIAYRIADNKSHEFAEWDNELLIEELVELGPDIEISLFTNDELCALMNITDEEETSQGGGLSTSFGVPPLSILYSGNPKWIKCKKDLVAYLQIDKDETRGDIKTYSGHAFKVGNKETKIETTVSLFDAFLCKLLIYWFSAEGYNIVDNYSGGCIRGGMSKALNRNYTGIDIRQEQIDENYKWLNKNVIDFNDNKVEWILGDGTNPKEVLGVDKKYDMYLTCPPYGNLEVYSDLEDDISNKDYKEFLRLYRRGISQMYELMNDDTFAVIVVGEFRDKEGIYNNFVGDTITAYIDAGFKYYNEIILATPLGSAILRCRRYMTASRKLAKVHQNILVFVKGDNIKATKKCGTIEITEPEANLIEDDE